MNSMKRIIIVPVDLSLVERINLSQYSEVYSDILEYRNLETSIGDNGVCSEVEEPLFPHDPRTVGCWEYDFHCASHGSLSSEEIKIKAEVCGWEVAKAEHLLALPNFRRMFPVVALGTVCSVRCCHSVLALRDSPKGCFLILDSWSDYWASNCRFMRVRRLQRLQLVA